MKEPDVSPAKDPKNDSDEFREYKRLILTGLQDLRESQKELHRMAGELQQTIVDLRLQVGEIKVRSGLYGLVMGGLATVLIVLAEMWLKK